MLRSFESLLRLLARFRHPVTLPEDVTEALGVQVSNFLSFDELLKTIGKSQGNPLSLAKFMPRKEAESAFSHATHIERFPEKTLISYFFPEGWVEFVLKFDRDSRLRRMYFLHKGIDDQEGIEISLCCSYIGHHYQKRRKIARSLSHVG